MKTSIGNVEVEIVSFMVLAKDMDDADSIRNRLAGVGSLVFRRMDAFRPHIQTDKPMPVILEFQDLSVL